MFLRGLYDLVKRRVDGSGGEFESVEDYMEFVLREVLKEEGEEEEFADRLKAVFLKKNINLEFGFQAFFGLLWAQQAFHEKFVRFAYKPVQEDLKI